MLYEQPVFIWDLLESFVLSCLNVRISQNWAGFVYMFLISRTKTTKKSGLVGQPLV